MVFFNTSLSVEKYLNTTVYCRGTHLWIFGSSLYTKRQSVRPKWLNPCPQVIGVNFHVHPVHLKKEGLTDERKQGSIDLIACPINPYVLPQSLIGCVDQSGRWALLIGSTRMDRVGGWVVMTGVVVTPPHTWCSHSTSVNTDTFILITFSLPPCTHPSSAAAGLRSSFITLPFTQDTF